MDETEVGLEKDVVEIVVVGINLDGAELTFVNDVRAAQGADVEPVGCANQLQLTKKVCKKERTQRDGVRRMLPQDVELALKVAVIEGVALFRSLAITVAGREDDKRLQDERLAAQGGGTEDGVVARDLSPTEDAQVERFGNTLESSTVLSERLGGAGLEEDVADGVLTDRRKDDIEVSLELLRQCVSRYHEGQKSERTRRKKASGMPTMTPAPSPSRASAPTAPRWVMLQRRDLASDTILCDGSLCISV